MKFGEESTGLRSRSRGQRCVNLYLVLVFFDADHRCDDAAGIEADEKGEHDDEQLVAEQSPAKMRHMMKEEEAANASSQVDDTDGYQQPHPHANRAQVRVTDEVCDGDVLETLDRPLYLDVTDADIQRQDHDDARCDGRLNDAHIEMHVIY